MSDYVPSADFSFTGQGAYTPSADFTFEPDSAEATLLGVGLLGQPYLRAVTRITSDLWGTGILGVPVITATTPPTAWLTGPGLLGAPTMTAAATGTQAQLQAPGLLGTPQATAWAGWRALLSSPGILGAPGLRVNNPRPQAQLLASGLLGTPRVFAWSLPAPAAVIPPGVTRYYCKITGGADGLADALLPISNFSVRHRQATASYYNVTIPSFAYVAALAARTHGEIVLWSERAGVTEELMRGALGDVSVARGPNSQSISISGNASRAATPSFTYVIPEALYTSTTFAGDTRLRIEPRAAIRPGDYVRYQELNFAVGEVSWSVAVSAGGMAVTMEVASLPVDSGGVKGIIRENLGESRYIVGVPLAVQPLADEIEKYTKLYQATIPKITDAFEALAEARDGYALLLAAVTNAAADYELCRLDFSPTSCIEAGQTACLNAYSEAESTCYEIESGVGECDPDCQRERARCIAAAARVRDACLAKVAIDCAELEYQHIQECQETHAPIIAAAQAAALEKLPAIQEAMYVLQTEQAIQFSLARKLNELEAIAAREYQITCFKAQYDAELAVGTEVEMAKTPNGRHAITGIITAPTPCLHDARVLPSGHLFVNASLAPGFETWRPTWRVGTVLEVIPPNLRVQFAPANIAGSLGTLYSENPLDCTPPQCYFDGKDPKEAEADIRAARTALTEAQQALVDAVALRAECIAEFDQAWMDQCYGTAVEICDAAFDSAMEQPTLDKGQCYDDAQGTCEEQTTAGLEACALTYQPAIDAAQGEVDAATAVLGEATGDLTGAQNALAAIEAEIQACVDAVNTQEWLDDERDRLTGLCAEAADDRKQECLDYGNTAAECQLVRDAIYADCVALIDEQLPLRQAAARDKCQDDRQADVDAAEGEIEAAYTAVNNAEIALRQVTDALEIAEKALADCLEQWVLGDCLASAIQICDDTYELAEDTYTQRRAACYQEAMAECDRQRDEAIDACYAAHADAIAAAQTAVDEAARDVELATNGRYHPADPLILEVPVAHCEASIYQVEDEVLIDFPVRSGATAMAVWDSRRVIGWASDTRECEFLSITYNPVTFDYLGDLAQRVARGGNGTPVTIITPKEGGYYAVCVKSQYLANGRAVSDHMFVGWSDGKTDNPRTEINVQDNIYVGAVGVAWPREIYLPIYYAGAEMAYVFAGAAKLQFYSETGIPGFFGTLHWFRVPWPDDYLEAIDWATGISWRMMGHRDNLPGILPEEITVRTKDLTYSGFAEQSKTYQRTGDVIEGDQCATPYLMYRYTRTD